jgi:hypothetical protein
MEFVYALPVPASDALAVFAPPDPRTSTRGFRAGLRRRANAAFAGATDARGGVGG